MVRFYKIWSERIKLGRFSARCSVIASVELPDIQKHNNKKIEGIQCFFLNWKATIAIGRISALHLNAHLRPLIFFLFVSWLWVDANEVVTLIALRRLVSQNISPHEVSHDEILCAG